MDKYGIDSHKLIYHPGRVAQWLEAGDDWEKLREVFPLYMEISPSGACNHRCCFCAFDYVGYNPACLSVDLMAKRLPEFAALGLKSILFGGEGEPLMNKNLSEIIELGAGAGIDMALTTNGALLDQGFSERSLKHLSWLKASIGGGRASTWASVHGVAEKGFDGVLQNMKKAVEIRESQGLKLTIGAQLLLLPENREEVEELALLCRNELKLDYLVVKPFSQHPSSLNCIGERLDYKNLSVGLEELSKKLSTTEYRLIVRTRTIEKLGISRPYCNCNSVPFFWAYLKSDGDVCCCSSFLGDERFSLGNLNGGCFQELWQGERRRKLVSLMRSGLDIAECRQNCRMDNINEYLWRLLNPVEHVNFI